MLMLLKKTKNALNIFYYYIIRVLYTVRRYQVWMGPTRSLLQTRYTSQWNRIIRNLQTPTREKTKTYLLKYMSFKATIHSLRRKRNGRQHGEHSYISCCSYILGLLTRWLEIVSHPSVSTRIGSHKICVAYLYSATFYFYPFLKRNHICCKKTFLFIWTFIQKIKQLLT